MSEIMLCEQPLDAEMIPSVKVFRPAHEIARYVTFYYIVDAPGPLTDFLYPEWGNVRFGLSGEWRVDMPGYYPPDAQSEVLYGPTDRCGSVTASGGRMAGFGLTALGWHRIIGNDASEFANRVVPLGDRLGVAADVLRRELAGLGDADLVARLETLIQAQIAARGPDDALIVAADRVLRERPATVPDFAALLGIAPRTLHRLCRRCFGFAPKRVLRRERFLETLGEVRSAVGRSLGGALASDYVDEPHFYRDFHDFMGMSPRAYFGAQRMLMAHAAAAQVSAGVPLTFKLPPQSAAPD